MSTAVDTFNYQKFDVVRYVPSGQSNAEQWMQWFKMLKSRFGKKEAQRIWLKAWIMRAGKGSSASTSDLREYMEGQGVPVETTTLESLGDSMSGVGDVFGAIFTGIKWFVIITAVGGLVLISFIIYKAMKNPKKTAMIVGSVTPQGRAAMVGSSAIKKLKAKP